MLGVFGEVVAKQRPEKFIVQDSTCLNRGITITGNTFGYCTENAIEINSAKQNVIVSSNILEKLVAL